jgi:predicted Zn-dependent peptidase
MTIRSVKSSSTRTRTRACALAVTSAVALAVTSAVAPAEAAPPREVPAGADADVSVSIPFTRSVLPNGLTVIFHENHDLPIVVVNVSYNVGSRFEQAGRTGFAHLFEHLMFMGTRRTPTKAFDAWMEGAGGWNNAWTSNDRTDYYDVGPPTSLDLLLWMEADRMQDLGPTMSLEKLDAQRDVVRNERRQTSENTPYGKVELRLPELLYPKEHPYFHPVIGSHADLEAATASDVKAFFARYYVPSNASLVVAGDFNPAEAQAKIARWFGVLYSPPPPSDPGAPGFSDMKTTLTSVVRETLEDNVELSKVVMAWQSPKHFAPGDADLDLLSTALAAGKASRLYKALVYEQKIAQSVEAAQESGVLGSRFTIGVLLRPGVPFEKVEAAIDKELDAIRKTPLADDEVVRARNLVETGFVTRLESVRERASLLNMYQTELKDPGFAPKDLARYRAATKESIRDQAVKYLDPKARVIIHVVPRKEEKKEEKKENAK